MKYLILVLLFSSCSVLETASKAVTVPLDLARFQGRMEVLEELKKNKKQLQELKRVLAVQFLDLTEQEEIQITMILPAMMATVQLLENRRTLKEHLATIPLSESAKEE